jgi:5-formyltetrahydrofolate cyclo-ligase
MATIKEEKKALRKKMAQLTSSLPEPYFNKKDTELRQKLLESPSVLSAKVILSYWSMPKEAATHKLNHELIKLGKKVLLPVINGNDLMLKYFTGIDNMKAEPKYGILEPQGDIFDAYEKIDLVIVPGVAFTKNGQRCGHGKGYYDRLLPKINFAKTIGLAYSHQIVEDLPTDDFDVTLNEVVFA